LDFQPYFRVLYPHACVHFHNSAALAKWVSQQRAQQAQGRLAADRKAKLDAIDFSWKLNTVKNRNTKTEDKKWMRQYDKLVAFHEENGHCKASKRARTCWFSQAQDLTLCPPNYSPRFPIDTSQIDRSALG
jgi:Helicase associated domain